MTQETSRYRGQSPPWAFPQPRAWKPRPFLPLVTAKKKTDGSDWKKSRVDRNEWPIMNDPSWIPMIIFFWLPYDQNIPKPPCLAVGVSSHDAEVTQKVLEGSQKKWESYYKWVFPYMGHPIMDGLYGKIPWKWMMTRGTPISGNFKMLKRIWLVHAK